MMNNLGRKKELQIDSGEAKYDNQSLQEARNGRQTWWKPNMMDSLGRRR